MEGLSKIFASNLQFLRKKNNFTQKSLAERLSYSEKTIAKWESGESVPDGHFLLRLMNWLQIDNVQELIAYRKPDTQDH